VCVFLSQFICVRVSLFVFCVFPLYVVWLSVPVQLITYRSGKIHLRDDLLYVKMAVKPYPLTPFLPRDAMLARY